MNTMIDYKNEKNQFSGLLRSPLLNKIQYNVRFDSISSEEDEKSESDDGLMQSKKKSKKNV